MNYIEQIVKEIRNTFNELNTYNFSESQKEISISILSSKIAKMVFMSSNIEGEIDKKILCASYDLVMWDYLDQKRNDKE